MMRAKSSIGPALLFAAIVLFLWRPAGLTLATPPTRLLSAQDLRAVVGGEDCTCKYLTYTCNDFGGFCERRGPQNCGNFCFRCTAQDFSDDCSSSYFPYDMIEEPTNFAETP